MNPEHPILITVNGEQRTVPSDLTLFSLLEYLEIKGVRVAVAHNKNVISRDLLKESPVTQGDQIEIVRMVGGG